MQKIQNPTSGSLSSSTFYPSGICFLVPSYMLEKLIKEGRPAIRDKALYNLKISELLRGQRIVNSKIPSLAAAAHQEKRRVIYDMKNSEDVSALPGTPVRYEGSNDIGDKNVDASYKNSGIVYDFYEKIFNRNSMNDQGMTLVSSAHFGEGYDNALWNGTQMVYGDGSDTFLKRDSLTALDVTGHEQTHGVTQYTARLDYSNQAGGLNESFSDCFGIMCYQWFNNQTVDDSHWLIGEGIMVDGKALRSMKDPGTANPADQQISNTNEYRDGMNPHISSGPPNKVFYLACKKVGGHSWEKIGKVWYITLTSRLRSSATYQEAADNTFDVSGSLFGEGSNEQLAVIDAWSQVGVQAKKPDLSILVTRR